MIRALAACALLIFMFATAPARADAQVEICYNYDCAATAQVTFSERQLALLEHWLLMADNAAAERRILGPVIGKLYRWAGAQSPIWADRGGDFPDDGVNGRMDCIDHATSTTQLLHMLDRRGVLRFHRVLNPVRRTSVLGIMQHYSAAIEERAGRLDNWQLSTRLIGAQAAPEVLGPDANLDAQFVVDSWFHDNGEPAEIMPLQAWMDGASPND